MKWVIVPLHNGGGLRANTRLQILDVYGNVIPGLYGQVKLLVGRVEKST